MAITSLKVQGEEDTRAVLKFYPRGKRAQPKVTCGFRRTSLSLSLSEAGLASRSGHPPAETPTSRARAQTPGSPRYPRPAAGTGRRSPVSPARCGEGKRRARSQVCSPNTGTGGSAPRLQQESAGKHPQSPGLGPSPQPGPGSAAVAAATAGALGPLRSGGRGRARR